MSQASLRHGLTAAIVTISVVCAPPVLAGTFAMTSHWDLENTRRMVSEAIPKQATDINIACETMNLAVGNDLSRCGASYRMP